MTRVTRKKEYMVAGILVLAVVVLTAALMMQRHQIYQEKELNLTAAEIARRCPELEVDSKDRALIQALMTLDESYDGTEADGWPESQLWMIGESFQLENLEVTSAGNTVWASYGTDTRSVILSFNRLDGTGITKAVGDYAPDGKPMNAYYRDADGNLTAYQNVLDLKSSVRAWIGQKG